MDQRAIPPAQPAILAIAAGQIDHVPAVLAVDPARHTCQGSRKLGLQSGQVAGVDNVRAQSPQEPPQPEIGPRVLALPLAQGEHRDIRLLDAGGEVGVVGQADHSMAKRPRRGPVDQVDQAVLHAPHPQGVDHMHHQRRPLLSLPRPGHGPFPPVVCTMPLARRKSEWTPRKALRRPRAGPGRSP